MELIHQKLKKEFHRVNELVKEGIQMHIKSLERMGMPREQIIRADVPPVLAECQRRLKRAREAVLNPKNDRELLLCIKLLEQIEGGWKIDPRAK